MALAITYQQQPITALQLFAAAEKLRQTLNISPPSFRAAQHENALTLIREHLTPSAFNTAWLTGQAWPLNQVIAYASGETLTPKSDTVQ